jgi:NAD-dependent SIR2 family protein deacetylase
MNNKIECREFHRNNKNPTQPEILTAKFYQTFKKELIPKLHKLFHKIERKEKQPNSFHEASIMLIQKTDKDTSKEKNIDQLF